MTDTSDLGELTITRTVDAPRETVFAAYVQPEQFVRFWGPVGTSVPLDSVTIEPWAGGRFDSTMVVDATGDRYPLKGVFREVQEPELFSFAEEGTSIVGSVRLVDLGDGRTEIVLQQTGLPPMYRSPEAVAGLNSSLDRLVEHLAGR
ncbi:SRPBCC domain-containing protein [Kitasatospora sp. NPDC056138]|uniref:SRPBCC family protein n=1 Tax=Kitasatospora sp. NPDC056138 TaxID=3345724 RepID=UPI0035D7F7BF